MASATRSSKRRKLNDHDEGAGAIPNAQTSDYTPTRKPTSKTRTPPSRKRGDQREDLSTPNKLDNVQDFQNDNAPTVTRSSTRRRKHTVHFDDQDSIKGASKNTTDPASRKRKKSPASSITSSPRGHKSGSRSKAGIVDDSEDELGGSAELANTIVVNGASLTPRKSKSRPKASKVGSAAGHEPISTINFGVEDDGGIVTDQENLSLSTRPGRRKGRHRHESNQDIDDAISQATVRVLEDGGAGQEFESSEEGDEEEDNLEIHDATRTETDQSLIPPSSLHTLRSVVLSKLYGRTPCTSPSWLQAQRTSLLHTLTRTVEAGESNSLLLIGARGTGKNALVESCLRDLRTDAKHKDSFHVIRLDGLIQTDDKLAVREILRQLGKEMAEPVDGAGSDDEDGRNKDSELDLPKSFADTLLTVLATFTHSTAANAQANGEVTNGEGGVQHTSQAVIFLLSEFHEFALSRARQTLLYNLFDIAQSRAAPIAVIGTTTRVDVADTLEKRVKSRFGHRYLHLGLPKTQFDFNAAIERAVQVTRDDLWHPLHPSTNLDSGLKVTDSDITTWNTAASAFLSQQSTQSLLSQIFHSSKSLQTAFSALALPIATLLSPTAASTPQINTLTTTNEFLLEPPSLTSLLPSLPHLSLALLLTLLTLQSNAPVTASQKHTSFSFEAVYASYVTFCSTLRLSSSIATTSSVQTQASKRAAVAAGAGLLFAGPGGRPWNRRAASECWRGLLETGLVISNRSSGTGSAAAVVGGEGGGTGGMELCRADVGVAEVLDLFEGRAGEEEVADAVKRWIRG